MAEPSDPARSLILFANSRRIGRRPDLLGDPSSASRALAKAGLVEPGTPVGPALRRRLIALRTALNQALAEDSAGWVAIDAVAAKLPLRLRFGVDGSSLTPRGANDPAALVLLHLHTLLATGEWGRIHLCANDICAVAFYDTTRSRTQRWHSYAMCGNRLNVAAHRARTTPT